VPVAVEFFLRGSDESCGNGADQNEKDSSSSAGMRPGGGTVIMPEVEQDGATLLAEPSDLRDEVVEQAESRLRSSPYLALRTVSCESRNGVLVLRGCLPTYYLKQLAQATVVRGPSVPTILNEIEVVGSGRHSW
jgi:hypothetical protein